MLIVVNLKFESVFQLEMVHTNNFELVKLFI